MGSVTGGTGRPRSRLMDSRRRRCHPLWHAAVGGLPKIEVQSPPSISLLDRCQVACSDDRMRFDFTTRASPEQVLRAPTDFTESRLETWNRTLDPKTYELRESDLGCCASVPGECAWTIRF
jgi:hypothetical protein